MALWRCPEDLDKEELLPRTVAWLDLGDGSGGAFYFGAQRRWRGFYRLGREASGDWRLAPAHAVTHAGYSDVHRRRSASRRNHYAAARVAGPAPARDEGVDSPRFRARDRRLGGMGLASTHISSGDVNLRASTSTQRGIRARHEPCSLGPRAQKGAQAIPS